MVAFGVSTWLALQTIVNLGAIVRFLPITGVPLPFVSYGGSSIFPTMAAMGLLLAVARNNSAPARDWDAMVSAADDEDVE